MKFLVLALAVACAYADVSNESQANTVSQQVDVHPEGYDYSYQTSNGIQAQAKAIVKDINSENPAQVVQGSYEYVGPDGVTYTVTYQADENGYQPQGAHLPTAPPVPADIARSLEYLAKAVPQTFAGAAKNVAPTFQPQQYKPQQYNKPQQYKPAFGRF